jgi:hypothetical protein
MSEKKLPFCGNPECCVTTTITECLSFGSGDEVNGFWEKPCLICARENERIDREKGKSLYMPYWPFGEEEEREKILNKIKKIESNPNNLSRTGFVWKYKRHIHRQLDDLRMELATLIKKEQKLRGKEFDESGYSGRQSNKR